MIFKKGEKVQHNDCCTKVTFKVTFLLFFMKRKSPKISPKKGKKLLQNIAQYYT